MSLTNIREVIKTSTPQINPTVAVCPTCRGLVSVAVGHCLNLACQVESAAMNRYERELDEL